MKREYLSSFFLLFVHHANSPLSLFFVLSFWISPAPANFLRFSRSFLAASFQFGLSWRYLPQIHTRYSASWRYTPRASLLSSRVHFVIFRKRDFQLEYLEARSAERLDPRTWEKRWREKDKGFRSEKAEKKEKRRAGDGKTKKERWKPEARREPEILWTPSTVKHQSRQRLLPDREALPCKWTKKME